jgi:hypothetical protein
MVELIGHDDVVGVWPCHSPSLFLGEAHPPVWHRARPGRAKKDKKPSRITEAEKRHAVHDFSLNHFFC